MDGQRGEGLTQILERAPRIPERERRLSWASVVVLAAGWPLVVALGAALEPPPADPDAAVPVLVDLAGMVITFGILATAMGALTRHPRSALMSLGVGVPLLALAIACPTSGHHGFGAWWYGQMALVTGMMAASVAAFRRAR